MKRPSLLTQSTRPRARRRGIVHAEEKGELRLAAPIITSSYYQPSTVSAGKVIIGSLTRSPDSMLERPAEVRFQGQWGGNAWLEGLGWEG